MSIRISNSAMDTYNSCPAKYHFKYIDKYYVNKTYTALLFGGSLDKALNYLLVCLKKKRPFKPEVVKWLFCRSMDSWYGQNELVYYKYEVPEDMKECDDKLDTQWAVFKKYIPLGLDIIDTYINEIVPEFDEVLEVQLRKDVVNADGDVLVLILDFVARLRDGRTVLFDNKSDNNKIPYKETTDKYGPNVVRKSQQLALYTEQYNIKLAGYIVLYKNRIPGAKNWKFVIDEVLESKKEEVYTLITDTVDNIKAEKFEKNEKSCFAFGRSCEYFAACKHNNYSTLVKK